MSSPANGPHLTDDQLVARLYGLEAEPNAHLEACEACSARWEQVQDRRATVAAAPSVSHWQLAAQRRQVLARMDHVPLWHWRRVWAPVLAAAAMLIAAGVMLYEPSERAAPPRAPVTAEQADPVWYGEPYSIQPVEPRAAGPLRELFEEEATE